MMTTDAGAENRRASVLSGGATMLEALREAFEAPVVEGLLANVAEAMQPPEHGRDHGTGSGSVEEMD